MLVNLWDELLSQVACYVILVCRPLAWKYYELTVMENFLENFPDTSISSLSLIRKYLFYSLQSNGIHLLSFIPISV